MENNRLKILHIWNVAGVASTLAKYQHKILKYKTTVVMRKKFDKFKFTNYGLLYPLDTFSFIIISLILAHFYDIIHVHSLDFLIPFLKFMYPNKPVIIHYHGSDIRGKWEKRKKYWEKADLILVSTPDLLNDAPENVYYLPNPVDKEIFKEKKIKNKGSALYIWYQHEKHEKGIEWAKKVAQNLGLKLIILNREKNPVPHYKMPDFLANFEFFIDHNYVPALSLTALEALAVGLKVVAPNGKILKGLPSEHDPINVIKFLNNIYKQLINKI